MQVLLRVCEGTMMLTTQMPHFVLKNMCRPMHKRYEHYIGLLGYLVPNPEHEAGKGAHPETNFKG